MTTILYFIVVALAFVIGYGLSSISCSRKVFKLHEEALKMEKIYRDNKLNFTNLKEYIVPQSTEKYFDALEGVKTLYFVNEVTFISGRSKKTIKRLLFVSKNEDEDLKFYVLSGSVINTLQEKTNKTLF